MSLAKQLGLQGPKSSKPLGKHLSNEDLDKLRDEQVRQLYELLIAAIGAPNASNASDDKKKTS